MTQAAAPDEAGANEWVSPGEMLYTGSPEGTGILAAQRGDDPFAVTTQISTLWRLQVVTWMFAPLL